MSIPSNPVTSTPSVDSPQRAISEETDSTATTTSVARLTLGAAVSFEPEELLKNKNVKAMPSKGESSESDDALQRWQRIKEELLALESKLKGLVAERTALSIIDRPSSKKKLQKYNHKMDVILRNIRNVNEDITRQKDMEIQTRKAYESAQRASQT